MQFPVEHVDFAIGACDVLQATTLPLSEKVWRLYKLAIELSIQTMCAECDAAALSCGPHSSTSCQACGEDAQFCSADCAKEHEA